ncbi:HEAT repeat [Candidatus Kryptonium thompsonii]|uniref:HEAT repeat domain-containing protein n=1 Tax=Candidatus Kryptonium thompsonii TaxID=1633631 RepID=UPI0007082170|nr:HEAT repeat domain-containing protein [Candidatus Kryptonium thompsoni]CUS77279.1 HEAT repeat [Candidatus Kryptonium thompsoni]
MSRAYETIISGLSSFDPDERRLSVEASVNFGDREEVLGKLLDLLKDEDKGVRDAVATALVLIANRFEKSKKKIVEGICNLIYCKDIGVRNLASELLLKIGEDAFDQVSKLATHEDKDVRKIAIDIIGLMKAKFAVDFLVEKLNDPDPNVVTSVIEDVKRLVKFKQLNLIDMFSKSEFARLQIVEALGEIGKRAKDKKVVCNFLVEAFEISDDPILKGAIVEALGKAGDEKYIDFLIGLIHDENVAVRKMATVAVVELCAQLGYKFGMREDLFKLFFEQGKEIFERTDDLNFKVCFLKFASERIELDEVKSFIIQLLDGNGEISEKAFEIVNERAKEFILFSLKNSVDDESFINLVELALYNSKEIFEDSVLKNLVLEKLLEIFNRVGAEKKIAVLNLISSLDKVIFEEILQKVKMDSDPILKAYLMSI